MTAARRQRGFTLLEAIVAMTVFAMCATALLGWQGQSLRSLDRVEARALRAEQVRSGLAVLASVNPMLEPRGERTLGARKVAWQARVLAPVKPGRSLVGLPTIFDIGLYDVAVSVQDDGSGAAEFHVRLVGYKQARTTGFAE